MLARILTALLALILAGMLPLHGQNQPTSVDAVPIATDRPAVTNFTVVVPAGSLQVEIEHLNYPKMLTGRDQRDSMATAQAYCNICQEKCQPTRC